MVLPGAEGAQMASLTCLVSSTHACVCSICQAGYCSLFTSHWVPKAEEGRSQRTNSFQASAFIILLMSHWLKQINGQIHMQGGEAIRLLLLVEGTATQMEVCIHLFLFRS